MFLQLKLLFNYFAKQVWSAWILYQQCRDRFSNRTLSIDFLHPTQQFFVLEPSVLQVIYANLMVAET